MLTCDVDIAILSIRPSVCLSRHVLYCIEMAYHIMIFSSAYGRPITLAFPVLKLIYLQKSDEVTLQVN